MSQRLYLLLFVLLPVGLVILAACSFGAPEGSDPQSAAGSSTSPTAADCASQYIPSGEAGQHVGEEVTVCGRIVDYIYKTGESGRPTLLLYDEGALIERGSSISDQQLPDTFEAIVWKEDAKNFPANFGGTYTGNTVCVTGTIETHNGNPAIIVRSPAQLEIGC